MIAFGYGKALDLFGLPALFWYPEFLILFNMQMEIGVAKAAFLGLGVMGYPMAGHLAAAGHEVSVFNRTSEKAERWVAQHGGRHATTPAEAAKDAEFVFACVGDDADIQAVTMGPDGAFSTMADEAVFIDNTTASANIARDLYQAARSQNMHFIDAPVSGGQAGAENGKLTVKWIVIIEFEELVSKLNVN